MKDKMGKGRYGKTSTKSSGGGRSKNYMGQFGSEKGDLAKGAAKDYAGNVVSSRLGKRSGTTA